MMNKMERRLYYISDIHLELSEVSLNFNLDSNCENYLALCGDIGSPFERNYENFLLEQSKKFKKVFIILGNHEYYNRIDYVTDGMFSSLVNIKYRDIKDVEDKVRKICSKINNLIFRQSLNIDPTGIIIFLTTKESFTLDDGTLFVGCTLSMKTRKNV